MALLATMLGAADASADDPGPPARPLFSFGGFGTLGVVHSGEGDADCTSSIFKPNGAGHTHEWSPAVDSLMAAQVTANPISKLSVVLQVVSEQRYDNTYWPHLEWLSVRYQITPDLSVRVGRVVMPTDAGVSLSSLPPMQAGQAAGLNAGLNGILGSIPVQATVSGAGRWEFARRAALNLQFDHTGLGTGSHGRLINVQPGIPPGGDVNGFSAAIDFVF